MPSRPRSHGAGCSDLDDAALVRLGPRRADVVLALRKQGATSLDAVDQAVLEPGGSILLTFKEPAEPATRADVARLEAKLDALLSS